MANELDNKKKKTLNEIADNNARSWCNTPGSDCSKQQLVMIGFMRGANYVLQEIEKCLEEPSMIQGYSDILAKVKQLKGE